MNRKNAGKLMQIFGLIIGIALSVSAARADFYVIPVPQKASAATLYKKTVVVSPGNTAVESGTALLTAIDAITDASSTNRYLIIIEPGVYDIGTETFAMKPYVDVQGSGENVTKITGSVSNIPPAAKVGVVEGADNAELRFVTVENTGTSTVVVAIRNSGASPTLTFVTASATGGYYRYGLSNNASAAVLRNVTVAIEHPASNGVAVGVENEGGSDIVMEGVTIGLTGNVSGVGVDLSGSTTLMRNVSVTVSTGGYATVALQNDGSTVYVEHSILSGPNWIWNSSMTYVANSRIEGGVRFNSHTITCAGVYDGAFTFYASSCPPPP